MFYFTSIGAVKDLVVISGSDVASLVEEARVHRIHILKSLNP